MKLSDLPADIRRRYYEEVRNRPTKDCSKDRHNRSQALLANQIKLMKLPAPLRDWGRRKDDGAPWYPRRWEADFAWPRHPRNLLVFLEGQVHAIKSKRSRDCERDNVLNLILGPQWTVFKFTPEQVQRLIAIDAISFWLGGEKDRVREALERKYE